MIWKLTHSATPHAEQFLASAQATLTTEQQALTVLQQQLDERFAQACALLLQCSGRVVVTGMGKSGHIARKIAATFASTGTPAFFMHPAEAAHGDLGMLVRGDVLLAISNSGHSDEIMRLLPVVQHYDIPLITISKDNSGPLPKQAHISLTLGPVIEACPLGLAPTSSTTATLALGDALAVALLEVRGFTQDDFALSHPAGMLGRRLLTHLSDLMHTAQELPHVQAGTSIQAAIVEMSSKRLGMTAIVDENGYLKGVFTDGDLRRSFAAGIHINEPVDRVMNRQPVTATPEMRAVEGLELMRAKKINQLLLVDDTHKLVGALNMHDFLNAGVS